MSSPGKHGSITNSELELLICRNAEFLSVKRSGSADGGSAGVYDSITGEYLRGIGPGRIPEYSTMLERAPKLVRGWRNILYDLLTMHRLRPTREVRSWLGDHVVTQCLDYGITQVPMSTPEPTQVWLDGSSASGTSGI